MAASTSDRSAIRSFERELRDVNKRTLKLVSLLMEILHKPSSNHVHRKLEDHRVFELKRSTTSVIADGKRLIAAVQANVRIIVEGTDLRISRTMLVSWYGVMSEVMSALQSASEVLGSSQSQPSIAAEPLSLESLAEEARGSQLTQEINIDSECYSLGENAANATSNALLLLKEFCDRLGMQLQGNAVGSTSANNAEISDPESSQSGKAAKMSQLIAQLNTLLEEASEVTKQLIKSLNAAMAEKDEPLVQHKFYDDANAFVKVSMAKCYMP
ncbi:hypothetical protein HK102_007010 [Quaeritorhiza haematococci]|nr:hypothetical protein HK102_007010 [Quaeritorhiza haematococci]